MRDTLLTMIVKDDPAENTDSISVTEPIRFYKHVTVTLTSMDSAIKVTDIHPEARQILDTTSGNKWSWSVLVTNADIEVSKLKLKLVTDNPVHYEERTLPINIRVEHSIWRKIYNYLMDNPKVLVVSILIPLVSFLGGLYLQKKKT